MTSDEVENAIRRNITWAKLSEEMRTLLGNSQREYEKRILDYSIRNQLRYKENIGIYLIFSLKTKFSAFHQKESRGLLREFIAI